MSNLPKRTPKDEREFDAELRREEPIKTEVIVELKHQNTALWATQASLLDALIAATDQLKIYRTQAMEYARKAADSRSACVPGCALHEWDAIDGWHRQVLAERRK